MPPAASEDADANLNSNDLIRVTAILLLTVVVFANGITGDFVHDDNRQIVRNDLIRDPHRWKQALTHDIWSFLGERDRPWSNYWRPGHVAWLILNFQLFGAANPVGWHMTNLLAHLVVIALAYVVLRRLGAARGVATTIVAIFAIHPTRAESVTWIAGVHDVLCTLWQLAALLCLMSVWRSREGRGWKWIAAIFFFTLAVSTKEVAIFFPVLVALVRWTDPTLRDDRTRPAIRAAVPFALIAAIFLVARYRVLGRTQIDFAFRSTYSSILATLPLVLCYYLRQMLLPWWLGWTYPLRAVNGTNMGVTNFYLPLAIIAVSIELARRMKWSRLQLIGLAILTLTLLPALNLAAFPPDNLVKDRFLYLPLLGFAMIVVPAAAQFLSSQRLQLAVTCLVVVLLAVRTIEYNRAWKTEVALWQRAVTNDSQSGMNHHQLAVALLDAGRLDEARTQIDEALRLRATPLTYLAAADLEIRQRNYQAAIDAAKQARDAMPHESAPYERLAVAHERAGDLAQAEQVLREARQQVPHRRAFFTDQLAVILVRMGRREEALTELESARTDAEHEFSPTARLLLFHLGMLYQEMGRDQDARQSLEKFIALTEGSADPVIVSARQTARAQLGQTNFP